MKISSAILSTMFVIFSISPTTHAQTVDETPCLKKIAANEEWAPLSRATMTCLETDAFSKVDFAAAISFLCSTDQKDFSDSYRLYLIAERAYNNAVTRFREATSVGPRRLASFDVQWAEQDWSIGGDRGEVSDYLNRIDQAQFHCESR